MKGKKKGPDAWKRTGPKHKTEVKRFLKLKSKIKGLGSQETKLLLAFAKVQVATDLTEPSINLVCQFLIWLRKNDFLILDAKRMVRLSLKLN